MSWPSYTPLPSPPGVGGQGLTSQSAQQGKAGSQAPMNAALWASGPTLVVACWSLAAGPHVADRGCCGGFEGVYVGLTVPSAQELSCSE